MHAVLGLLSILSFLYCTCENTCYHAFVRDGECNDGLHPNVTGWLHSRRKYIQEGYWECTIGTDCDDCGTRCF